MTAYHFACIEVLNTTDGPGLFPNQPEAASQAQVTDECTVWWHWDYPVVRATVSSHVACRATLTGEARRYLARAPAAGFVVQPTRWIVGTGLPDDPSWKSPATASRDTTYVTNFFAMGSAVHGDLLIESANASSLSIKCRGPVTQTVLRDLLVYAKVYDPATKVSAEFPFAAVKLQPWYAVVGQRFTARVIVPLGDGTYEADYPYFDAANQQDTATASDNVIVNVTYIRSSAESLNTNHEAVTVV